VLGSGAVPGAERAPAPAPLVTPAAWRGHAIRTAVLVVLIVFGVMGWRWLRVVLRVHGVAVSRFEDSSSNLRLIFSDPGWCFLGLGSKAVRAPQWDGEVVRDTIRGAFFLRAGGDGPPLAVLIMRIEGMLGLSSPSLQPRDRAVFQQNSHRTSVAALGGQYWAMLPGDDGGRGPDGTYADVVLDAIGRQTAANSQAGTLPFGRFAPIRVEGRAMVPGGYYLWSEPGPYRVITLISLEDARIYYAHIVLPEEHLAQLTKVTRVLADPIVALRKKD
jgi:hypothetical protein